MAGSDHNDRKTIASPASRRHWRDWGPIVLGLSLFVSILVHVLSGIRLGEYEANRSRDDALIRNKQPVKIRIIEKPKVAEKKDEKKEPEPELDPKKILETPQQATAAPKQADYLGTVNHVAEKEQRVSNLIQRDKAKDPGQKGKPDAQKKPKTAQTKPQTKPPEEQTPPEPKQKAVSIVKNQGGALAFGDVKPKKPRNDYEALLPSSVDDLPGQLNAGYQDYVDDKVLEGDRIDINTSEYRFIGYFTNLRKAIELVWNYPIDAARRGLQGEVLLEFAIARDGTTSRIRVLKSSGYEVLDKNMVDTIRLASPFAPLPDGFGKEKIVVTGAFRYILTAFGSH